MEIAMKSHNLAYNPRLDHLRFFAAAIVFYFHFSRHLWPSYDLSAAHPWAGIVSQGHTGVGLFFTLSGFLFMLIALKSDQLNYMQFLRNRMLRIFPLFLFVFFISISLNRDAFQATDIFYIFFSNLGDSPTSKTFMTGPAWTISIEFTFYAVFPFLASISRERGLPYLFSLIALLLLFKIGAYLQIENSIKIFYSTLLGRFDQFLIGMIFAFFHFRHSEKLQSLSIISVAIGALIVTMNSAIQGYFYPLEWPEQRHPMWIFWSLQESIGWGIFILTWINANFRIPRMIDNVMTRGGEISFSIYLIHATVISIFVEVVGSVHLTGHIGWDLLILGTATFTLVWAVASLSYEVIERPFLNMRTRYA